MISSHTSLTLSSSSDRQDEAPDRAALSRAQDRLAQLETELGALKVRQLEFETMGPQGLGRLAASGQAAAAQRAAELQGISECSQPLWD